MPPVIILARHASLAGLLALALGLWWPATASAQATAGAKPAVKASGADLCLPCHAELKEKFNQPSVHTPVKMGSCEGCHNPHAARFPKLLSEQGGSLCYACHTKQKAAFARKVVHRPVRNGECTACHDPHAAREKFQLTKAGGELCMTCHAQMKEQPRKVSHLPFEAGDCLTCHDPHASDQPGLLTQPSAALCQSCHDLQDAKIKRAHGPFKMDKVACEQCHNPHASDGKALAQTVMHPPVAQGRCGSCHQVASPDPVKTVLTGKDLCMVCHADITKDLAKKSVHAPLAAGQCTSCHNPHGSGDKGLLADKERTVCLGCHKNMAERLASSRSVHPEKAGQGRCTICHTGHSSDQPKLAVGEPLKMCSACHETHASMSHPMGAGIIDVRTQGPVTCLSCHDAHGTPLPSLLTFNKERELCIQCHKTLR